MKQTNQHPFHDKRQEDSTMNIGKTDRSALRYLEEVKDSMEKISIDEEQKQLNLESDYDKDEENIYMEMGYLTN